MSVTYHTKISTGSQCLTVGQISKKVVTWTDTILQWRRYLCGTGGRAPVKLHISVFRRPLHLSRPCYCRAFFSIVSLCVSSLAN